MDTLNLTTLTPLWQQLQPALLPIENDDQHGQAMELLAPVWDAVGEDAAHPLAGLLRLMVARIQEYEDGAHPSPPSDPAHMLRYLMELRGLSQRALAEATGIDQGNLSKLVAGKRDFTTEHVRKLSAYFNVDVGLFIG